MPCRNLGINDGISLVEKVARSPAGSLGGILHSIWSRVRSASLKCLPSLPSASARLVR